MSSINRRRFLRLGGAAGVAALLPVVFGRRSRAQGGAIPKRLVVIDGPDGAIFDGKTAMAPAGMSAPSRTDFRLPPWIAPLEPYRDRMIYFQNVEMITNRIDPTRGANAHLTGSTHFVAPFARVDGNLPGGESIDQFIARSLPAARGLDGAIPGLRSMNALLGIEAPGSTAANTFGTHPSGRWGMRAMHFSTGPGALLSSFTRPSQIFDQVFRPEWRPSDVGSMPPPPAMPTEPPAAERLRRILEAAVVEHGRVGENLAVADRAFLDEHLEQLTDYADRTRWTPSSSTTASIASAVWPERDAIDWRESIYDGEVKPFDTMQGVDRWNHSLDTMLPLVARALQFRLTHVVCVQINSPSPALMRNYQRGKWGTSDEHDLTHQVNNFVRGSSSTIAASDENAAYASVLADKVNVADKVKVLIDELATLQESDGSSLLDHTVVLYVSHIADGSHDVKNVAGFTVGNWDGILQTGQYLDFPRVDAGLSGGPVGRSHLDLFHTLAEALGLDWSGYGWTDARVRGGLITEMLA